jgi:hypothetical protein
MSRKSPDCLRLRGPVSSVACILCTRAILALSPGLGMSEAKVMAAHKDLGLRSPRPRQEQSSCLVRLQSTKGAANASHAPCSHQFCFEQEANINKSHFRISHLCSRPL